MEKQNLTTGFQHVDHAQHQFLIKFLEDAGAEPMVREGFALQLDRLDIREGNEVLDVGCGIGLQAHEMAKLVGATGKVVGTDLSTVMIDIAKSRTARSDLPLEFLVADALAQPFPDASFDRLRTERVLMYIKDLPAVIREFRRLVRPGGKIVLFDFDWDGTVIDHRDKALTRKIVRYGSESFPNGRVGGELFRQLRIGGFSDVQVKPFSYAGTGDISLSLTKRIFEGILQTGVSNGVFSAAEIADWWTSFDEDGRQGDLFMSIPGFIASGTKG